jgi:hypothetical protein
MTLLIALIANELYRHEFGEVFISPFWVYVLWFFHVCYHEQRKVR